MEVGEHEEHIRQTTVILPYFDYEVPVLYLQDGKPYIPVVELCKMLGLHADTHIPRWRKLVLWYSARKLPYQKPTRGRRIVWCLHAGAMLFWFCCFDWSLVLPERRAQLQKVTDEGLEVLAQTHQKMLNRYKSIRHQLFQFLTTYSDIETMLSQFSPSLHVYLNDFDVCIAWEDLITQGKVLIDEATAHARRMLQDQAAIPVVDAVKMNAEGEVIEELALPLFPLVQEEDIICFFENLGKTSRWYQQIADFLGAHGIIWDEEQKKWYLA
jgi:hypothetical protein